MATVLKNMGYSVFTLGENGWDDEYNAMVKQIDAFLFIEVISATTTAEPGSPADGDRYILPASSTGTNWAGNDGKVAVWNGSSWDFHTPKQGWLIRAKDRQKNYIYDSSAWRQQNAYNSHATGITASTTQTQGQQPLTADVNEISTCANANDVVTAPNMKAGRSLTIINNGAAVLQVYPASGEDLGAGTNTSVTVAATGGNAFFMCYSDGSCTQLV